MIMQNNQIPELKIEVPGPVKKILDTLKAHGYEAYIVGGCVRDALLGRVPEDWDITTSALPPEVKELFRSTVDTGIQHGTVMVILEGAGYEVTTYRIDGPYMDSRHPMSVTFTRSLEEDLKRRDFTINAFAWDENGLVDHFNGLEDLEHRIIRCVGDPSARFDEDALRIMRAVRFSAQLGFEIEPETAKMAQHYADRLADISMERIRVEWEKTLLSDHPCLVNRYAEYGMALYIVEHVYGKCFDPARNGLLEELHRRRSQDGLPEETLDAGPGAAGDKWNTETYRQLMLAAFFGNLTPEEADRAFRYLKYDNKTREAVTSILRYQDMELSEDRVWIRQALNRMGADTFFAVLELRSAMQAAEAACGTSGADEARQQAAEVQADAAQETTRIRAVRTAAQDIIDKGEPYLISQLAVSGTDLIAAGVPAGKKIGEFLENILQKVIQSPTLNTKEKLCNSEFLLEVEHECKRNL